MKIVVKPTITVIKEVTKKTIEIETDDFPSLKGLDPIEAACRLETNLFLASDPDLKDEAEDLEALGRLKAQIDALPETDNTVTIDTLLQVQEREITPPSPQKDPPPPSQPKG